MEKSNRFCRKEHMLFQLKILNSEMEGPVFDNRKKI